MQFPQNFLSSNQQRVKSNKQKTNKQTKTSNKQKVTTNEKKLTTNKQREESFTSIFFRKIGFPNILTSKVSFIYFKSFGP